MSKARLKRARAATAVPESARTSAIRLGRKQFLDLVGLARANGGLSTIQTIGVLRIAIEGFGIPVSDALRQARGIEAENPTYDGIELGLYRAMIVLGLLD